MEPAFVALLLPLLIGFALGDNGVSTLGLCLDAALFFGWGLWRLRPLVRWMPPHDNRQRALVGFFVRRPLTSMLCSAIITAAMLASLIMLKSYRSGAPAVWQGAIVVGIVIGPAWGAQLWWHHYGRHARHARTVAQRRQRRFR